jgi:hypothetical protein
LLERVEMALNDEEIDLEDYALRHHTLHHRGDDGQPACGAEWTDTADFNTGPLWCPRCLGLRGRDG